jgi:hypothetical protein
MFISIMKKTMNTPLAEGIPWGKSLRQPTEDFYNHFWILQESLWVEV